MRTGLQMAFPSPLIVLLAVLTPQISAGTYVQDFNAGSTGGWGPNTGEITTWLVPTGGVDGSGYLRGVRQPEFGPTFCAVDAPATTSLTGDMEAKYGHLIEFSCYGRTFANQGDLPVLQGFAYRDPDSTVTFWAGTVGPVAPLNQDWTELRFVVDTNWTDAEANAHGWTRWYAADRPGTEQWSYVMHNLTVTYFLYGWESQDGNDYPNAGIDNVRVASVPEPSTLVLLGMCAAGLLGFTWRRRKRTA